LSEGSSWMTLAKAGSHAEKELGFLVVGLGRCRLLQKGNGLREGLGPREAEPAFAIRMADLLSGFGIASDLPQENLEVRAALLPVLLRLVGPTQEIVACEEVGVRSQSLFERRDGGVEVVRLDGLLACQKILDTRLLFLGQGSPAPDRESYGQSQPLVHETLSFGLDLGSLSGHQAPKPKKLPQARSAGQPRTRWATTIHSSPKRM